MHLILSSQPTLLLLQEFAEDRDDVIAIGYIDRQRLFGVCRDLRPDQMLELLDTGVLVQLGKVELLAEALA